MTPITKVGTGATTANGALTNLGVTATATELNYVDGVTSNIQTQLNEKANYETKSSTDFNSMTTPGLYTMRSSSTNAPTSGTYHSLIVNKSDNGNYVQQIAIKEGTTDMYLRELSGGAWSNWAKVGLVADYVVTISTNWTGSSAPYTQTITVTGLTNMDTPIVDVVLSSTTSTALSQLEAWNCVSKITTGTNQITVTCLEDKPTTAIPIQLKVMGTALISQRSSRYTTIKFDNYGTGPTLSKGTTTSLSVASSFLAATTVGSYALFGGGYDGSSTCSTLDYYRYSENNKTVYLHKGAKYKFQNMDSEQIYSSTMGSISIPTPATGYIKIKNTTIS